MGVATRPGVDGWYAQAEKAALNPPDWVFGVVWATLYVMMGAALSFVLGVQGAPKRKKQLVKLFLFQLALNLAWSFVFFQFRLLWLATAWVAVLVALVLFFIVRSWGPCRAAALLLLPYLGWLCFAFYLSLSVTLLNG